MDQTVLVGYKDKHRSSNTSQAITCYRHTYGKHKLREYWWKYPKRLKKITPKIPLSKYAAFLICENLI